MAPVEEKKHEHNIYENILNAIRYNMIRKQQKEKKKRMQLDTNTSGISYSEIGNTELFNTGLTPRDNTVLKLSQDPVHLGVKKY